MTVAHLANSVHSNSVFSMLNIELSGVKYICNAIARYGIYIHDLDTYLYSVGAFTFGLSRGYVSHTTTALVMCSRARLQYFPTISASPSQGLAVVA